MALLSPIAYDAAIEQEKLNFNIRLSIRHASRILYAMTKIQAFLPLKDAKHYQQLNDDKRSGGDIDFLVYLKSMIGDQKIDLVLANASQHRAIDKVIKNQGILLL